MLERATVEEAVEVAVGVLIDAEGRFLLTSRPEGKVYAGYWEFPGGKVEAGESVEAALARELLEELGIEIDGAERWRAEVVDYPHARVRLNFCKVFGWRGALQMREGQRMAWQQLPVQVQPVLRGTLPVLAWLAGERGFSGAPYTESMDWLDDVKWDAAGLVTAIAQEQHSGDVLMVAWMNRESLAETVSSGRAVYWSRSRQCLWRKGEESGHVQQVHDLRLDCDGDVVLLTVTQQGHDPGIACHTGRHSCFFRRYDQGGWAVVSPVLKDPESIYR